MTKIRVTALTADGDPYGNALVTVRLVDAGSGGAVGGGLVVAPQTAKTDGTTGIAIVDLTPTADVTPVGTYYAFTVNQSNPTVVRYIEVPAPNGTGDAEVPFDWDDPDLERLTATPPTHIPAPDSGVAGQVLGVVDPGDGPRYDLIDQTGGGAVDSVNGQTGVVVLDADDIGDGTTNKAYTATEKTKLASLNLPFTTGDYYSLSGGETASTAPALSPAGVMFAHPVYLQAGNYDRVAMYVATAAVSTYRLGVYPNNAATYKPDGQTLILDAGTLNMNAGTGIQQVTVSLTIPTSGIYWLAVLCDSYTAKPSIVGWAGNQGQVPNLPYFGSIVYGNVTGRSPFGVVASSVATGAMPTTFPTTTRTDVLPQITVRKAT